MPGPKEDPIQMRRSKMAAPFRRPRVLEGSLPLFCGSRFRLPQDFGKALEAFHQELLESSARFGNRPGLQRTSSGDQSTQMKTGLVATVS